ncbi:MAG TPA: hypothetical protein VF074_22235 [Pyrinomonadaceae bacterium]
MKAYVITTGALFGLLTIAHILRIVRENPALVRDPFYVLLTILTAVLSIWAFYLVRRSRKAQ